MQINSQVDLFDIRRINKNKFKSIIKEKIRTSASVGRGSEGKEIKYTDIEMSDYLCPNKKHDRYSIKFLFENKR